MSELDLDALKRRTSSKVTILGRNDDVRRVLVPLDEWDAILAALERAEIRCSVHERLETAAQALIDVLQDDDPTEFWWFDEYNGLLAALAAAPEGRHG